MRKLKRVSFLGLVLALLVAVPAMVVGQTAPPDAGGGGGKGDPTPVPTVVPPPPDPVPTPVVSDDDHDGGKKKHHRYDNHRFRQFGFGSCD